MKLIESNTNFVVLEYQGEKTIFNNPYLEKEMENIGVVIPQFLTSNYNGKNIIKKDDTLFQKAFKNIYYPLNMNNEIFKWVE